MWTCLRPRSRSFTTLCACSTTSDRDVSNIQAASPWCSRASSQESVRNIQNSAHCNTIHSSWGLYKFVSTVFVSSRFYCIPSIFLRTNEKNYSTNSLALKVALNAMPLDQN